jgi:hypothetical protein
MSDEQKDILGQAIDAGKQALWLRYRLIVYLVALLIIVGAGWWAWDMLHPGQPVTYESQQQAETPQGVQEAAHNAGVYISSGQTQEIAQDIQEAATRPPDQIIPTTGAGMTQTLASVQQQTGSDMQIVTDPAKPDQKPTKPPDNQPVNLNVYNIKAYPKHLVEATIYSKAADLAYMTRVKVFGYTGYLGPAVNYDADRASKVRVGVRLSVPID